MPAAIPAIIGAGVGATIGIQIGTMVVLGALQRKLVDRKTKDLSKHPSNQREFTVRAVDAYENFVYGKAMIGGLRVYNNAVSPGAQTNNVYVDVVKWAGHRVNCLEYFRLDNRYLNPASDTIQWDPVTYTGCGTVETGEFTGGLPGSGSSPTFLTWYKGDQTVVDSFLSFATVDWPATSVGRERAYGVLRVLQVNKDSLTDKVYAQGIPNDVFAYVHGKSVYQHDRGSLNGDPTLFNVSSQWTTGDNSAQLAYGLHSRITSVGGVGGATDHAVQTDVTSTDGLWRADLFSEPMPCSPTSQYSWMMRARRPRGVGRVYRAGVAFWTDDGDLINNGVSTFHYFMVDADVSSLWTEYHFKVGSGLGAFGVPDSARLMRPFFLGVNTAAGFPSSGTLMQVQELTMWLGTSSRQTVDVSTTWTFSQNPAWCAADYLRNEQFGFGKESRQPVNASRYALNSDPTWRRRNTLTVTSHWSTDIHSGTGSAISALASLTNVAGAPAGRRALVMVASAGSPFGGQFIASNQFPVDHTGNYVVSMYAYQVGPKQSRIDIAWCYASGEWFTSTIAFSSVGAAWSNYLFRVGSGTGNSIPTSARFVSLVMQVPRSFGANTATEAYLQEFQCHVGTTIKRFIEPWEQIDWTSASSAAAYCDYVVQTPSGTQARFTCNGQGNTGKTYRENLRDILSAGGLRCTYSASGWQFFGGWQQPQLTLNKADFRSGIEGRGAYETDDRYSGVRASFYDRHQDHKLVPAATITAPEYVARDNSMRLYEDIDLPYTNDWWQAQRNQFIMLEQGDNQGTFRSTFGHKAMLGQPGQQFAVRNDVLSWSPKYFMLTEMTYDIPRGVQFLYREDFEESYVDPTSAEYVPRSGPSVASTGPYVPFVSSVTATYLGRDGVRLRWVNPANRAFEWVDIYRDNDPAFSGAGLVKSTRADEWTDADPFAGVNSVTAYYWFRTRDFMGSVSSPYFGVNSGFAVAPTVPAPASLTATYLGRDGVRLRWVNPTSSPFFEWVDVYRDNDPDFAGSAIIKSTRGDEWVDVSPFAVGANAYYWVRNRDHAGNLSAVHPNSAVTVTPFPIAQISSVVVTPRIEGVQLRWVNPSSAGLFEWIDIYRREATNAFSGSTLIKSTRNDEYLDPLVVGDNFKTWYYWFQTRDWVGNASSVYPGLTTSFATHPLPAGSRDPEYVFFEEFNYRDLSVFKEKWQHTDSLGLVTFVTSGEYGGYHITVSSGEAQFVSKTLVPYDAEATYQMFAGIKTITSADSLRTRNVVGVVGFASDGVTKIDYTGADTNATNPFVSNGRTLTYVGSWQEFVGHLHGHMAAPLSGTMFFNLSDDPKGAARMRDGVRYIAPSFVLCYSGSSPGVQAVDYIGIRKVSPTGLVFDEHLLEQKSWVYGANGVFGAAVWDLLNGPLPDYRTLALVGRYNVAGLPTSNNSLFAMVERFNPGFHTTALANNSATLYWTAEVLGASGGDAFVAAVYVVYTAAGSPCYFGQGTTFTIGSRDVWQTAMSVHRFFPSDINPNSYPPPWFVSVGATALSSTTSVFLSKLRVTVT